MKLRDWLAKERLSPTEFAKRLGRPQATIARYVSGSRIPEQAIMAEIVEATNGEVVPNDFYDLPAPPEPQKAAS